MGFPWQRREDETDRKGRRKRKGCSQFCLPDGIEPKKQTKGGADASPVYLIVERVKTNKEDEKE